MRGGKRRRRSGAGKMEKVISDAVSEKASADPAKSSESWWPFRLSQVRAGGLYTSTLTKHWVQAAPGREHDLRWEDSLTKAV